MADIHSATAEIRRGKKIERKKKNNNNKRQRATITKPKQTQQEGQHPLTGERAANFRLLPTSEPNAG